MITARATQHDTPGLAAVVTQYTYTQRSEGDALVYAFTDAGYTVVRSHTAPVMMVLDGPDDYRSALVATLTLRIGR